jgi:hypothetical protein
MAYSNKAIKMPVIDNTRFIRYPYRKLRAKYMILLNRKWYNPHFEAYRVPISIIPDSNRQAAIIEALCP